MLVHISCNGWFLAPKRLLSHSSDLGICTCMANTNIITFTDLDEVVGMLQVNFGIHRGLSWAVKEVGDVQKQILAFLCDFVQASKVSTERERAVFLSSTEHQSTMWREQSSDEPHS